MVSLTVPWLMLEMMWLVFVTWMVSWKNWLVLLSFRRHDGVIGVVMTWLAS